MFEISFLIVMRIFFADVRVQQKIIVPLHKVILLLAKSKSK